METVVIQPIAEFFDYHLHTLDPKMRLTIPEPYSKTIAERNEFNLFYGLERHLYDVSSEGLFFQGRPIFKFKERVPEVSRLTPEELSDIMVREEVDRDIYIKHNDRNPTEVRCYAPFDWVRLSSEERNDSTSIILLTMDSSNRIIIPRFIRELIGLDRKVGIYGRGDHFAIGRPHQHQKHRTN